MRGHCGCGAERIRGARDRRRRRRHQYVLQGIDCPERGQAFGGAAKRFTADLVFGKTVGIQPRTTDRYGRMVADESIEGRDVGLALVETGLAWHFTRYSSDPKLAATQQAARAARRDL